MAFVNEKLTPTQREELAKKKIKNPYGTVYTSARTYPVFTAGRTSIDRRFD